MVSSTPGEEIAVNTVKFEHFPSRQTALLEQIAAASERTNVLLETLIAVTADGAGKTRGRWHLSPVLARYGHGRRNLDGLSEFYSLEEEDVV